MAPASTPSGPQPRATLEGVPAYRAGRPAGSDALKLSSNENPFGPLPGVVEKAAAELARVNRYPDAGVTRLYDALAAQHGQPAERFAAGTGSVAVLFSLIEAFAGPGDEVVHAWRSFEAYPIGIRLSGATAVPVPVLADGTHDLDAMAAAVTERTKIVLVCTPNNPTGPVVEHEALVRFLDALPVHVVCVVDEAYVEFVRDPAAARGADLLDRPNVVVLRTFSKAYGLAGLRVGFAIATPEVADAIRRATAPFSVTDVAQAAAVASLGAQAELDARVESIVAERVEVVTALRAQGWQVPDTEANFVWLPVGDDALDLAETLHPVSVRPFAGDGVRVTIGDPETNARFLDLAARWLTTH